MRKPEVIIIFLVIFCLLIITPPSFSQEGQKLPEVVVKEREFDFGKVNQGEHIKHDFVILNQGNAVLEIKKVKPG